MNGFDSGWLSLREPCDHRSRSAALTKAFATAVGGSPCLIDLGCGTGSNLRYLAPRLVGAQHWRCVDHDPALLDAARERLAAWAGAAGWPLAVDGDGLEIGRPNGAIRVRFEMLDLAAALPAIAEADGVTGAALLDLTTADWLDRLASATRTTPLLMALTFDGRFELDPAHASDAEVVARFNAHQVRDKGFGPALGGAAAAYLADRLAAAGNGVQLAPADWHLGPAEAPLIRATLDGLTAAAREIVDDVLLDDWARTRRADIAAGGLRLTSGHVDLLALPRSGDRW